MRDELSALPAYFATRIVVSEDGCWLWTAYRWRGYATTASNKYGTRRAHRVVYKLLVGPIPEGLTLDHLCRVRHCVNPAHLEAVTSKENVLRGIGITAKNTVKTHCPNGHPYSGDNLMVVAHKSGSRHRHCRACTVARTRQWRDRMLSLQTQAHVV